MDCAGEGGNRNLLLYEGPLGTNKKPLAIVVNDGMTGVLQPINNGPLNGSEGFSLISHFRLLIAFRLVIIL
jgi:hypothetical protein